MDTQIQSYKAIAAVVLMYAGDMYVCMYICMYVLGEPGFIQKSYFYLQDLLCFMDWAVNRSGSKKIATN
jgi:hypothetical protein